VLIGLAAGALGAVWAAGLIASLLYGVQPQDVDTLLVAALVLGGIATLASWLPAYRVTRLDPAGVLRAE
jgi:ABC-type lipoprotein release transport system permease subunit